MLSDIKVNKNFGRTCIYETYFKKDPKMAVNAMLKPLTFFMIILREPTCFLDEFMFWIILFQWSLWNNSLCTMPVRDICKPVKSQQKKCLQVSQVSTKKEVGKFRIIHGK